MPKSGCILWEGRIKPDGYGLIQRGRKQIKAHRVAYVKAHGLQLSDIAGKVVRHTCDVRRCVNPDHLVIGTLADNNHDRAERNRSAKGSKNGSARLTEDQIPFIRYWLECRYSLSEIGRAFNINYQTVKHIRNGRCWGHV